MDLSKLDKLIHEKARLGIMSLLASRAERWAFQDLKSELKMSDGNLITHLRTLEKANFVLSEKVEGLGRPQTFYELTDGGRSAFESYLAELEKILRR
ncbi:transcriptional regulator [bacterium]|nr:transcriptional regulator [Akkermansiaceae bacterium]MDB4522349.1 transcriptional regulator [bacterium]MDB4505000.1 transcriptional regulator [Akkermansiaceae bacterium]MDB4568342.1 transcriptional regulator [Akkermansiaceae bacterium]MDB4588295.1 transcriptional regulator [bacterium]